MVEILDAQHSIRMKLPGEQHNHAGQEVQMAAPKTDQEEKKGRQPKSRRQWVNRLELCQ